MDGLVNARAVVMVTVMNVTDKERAAMRDFIAWLSLA